MFFIIFLGCLIFLVILIFLLVKYEWLHGKPMSDEETVERYLNHKPLFSHKTLLGIAFSIDIIKIIWWSFWTFAIFYITIGKWIYMGFNFLFGT